MTNNDFVKNIVLHVEATETGDKLVTGIDIHIDPGVDTVNLVDILLQLIDEVIYSVDDVLLLKRGLDKTIETGEFPKDLLNAERDNRRQHWENARILRDAVLRIINESEENDSDSDDEENTNP